MCSCWLDMWAQVPQDTYGNQKMACVGQFSFLITWVLGIELWSLGSNSGCWAWWEALSSIEPAPQPLTRQFLTDSNCSLAYGVLWQCHSSNACLQVACLDVLSFEDRRTLTRRDLVYCSVLHHGIHHILTTAFHNFDFLFHFFFYVLPGPHVLWHNGGYHKSDYRKSNLCCLNAQIYFSTVQ